MNEEKAVRIVHKHIERLEDEIDRLRVERAKLVRKIDSACITLGLGLGDLSTGQQPVGAREWREIAERVYQALKADTRPEPKA